MKRLFYILMVALAVPAFADEVKQQAPATQQYQLIAPSELEALKKAAKAGLDKRSKETLRHMYTAAALHGILANPDTAVGDVTKNAALAKSYGHAFLSLQDK